MAIVDRNTLKGWFVRGAKPLATQFAAWIDSYWHKGDFIPIDRIDGLQDSLNSKASSASVDEAARVAASAATTADEAMDAVEDIGAIEIPDINNLFEEED